MPTPASVSGLTLSISTNDYDSTYAKLLNVIDENPNINVMAEVNHMANASSVDLELNPTRVIFFGNPSLGTPLMQKNQLAGLDLPQKIVTYQDANNDVYMGFNSTAYLMARHELENVITLPTISTALTTLVSTASGNDVFPSTSITNISGQRISTKVSTKSFEDTYNTLKSTIQNNPNLRVIAEVNHQENAINAGLELRPTRLIIFGNPNLGTPLMQNRQTAAIDLPQKMLVWKDENGVVKVSHNFPGFLKLRHGIAQNDTILETVGGALNNLSNIATGI